MTSFTPREIVSELDRYIVGQNDAKRAVAIALRNRWRRQQLDDGMREEVLPKNILMIGPTGVGKTEIARRLAKLAQAPFLKVEATKFTEVGYVGRDVEQIVRDLVEIAIAHDPRAPAQGGRGEGRARRRGPRADGAGRRQGEPRDPRPKFRRMLREGELDRARDRDPGDRRSGCSCRPSTSPACRARRWACSTSTRCWARPSAGRRRGRKKMTVAKSYEVLVAEEADKLLDEDRIVSEAIDAVENNGIVFLDEIDKITARSERVGADVSREGVQRDLLPLIEGTIVPTKHGTVKTDHILFIASGAFHIAKPSDLLPELQGRLPIRVELKALTRDDFVRILTEPEASLIKQYKALLATEEVDLDFTDDAIEEIATLAAEINSGVENIGARRLQTVMEKLLEEISFTASERGGERIEITAADVRTRVGELAKNADLTKFIL